MIIQDGTKDRNPFNRYESPESRNNQAKPNHPRSIARTPAHLHQLFKRWRRNREAQQTSSISRIVREVASSLYGGVESVTN